MVPRESVSEFVLHCLSNVQFNASYTYWEQHTQNIRERIFVSVDALYKI